MILELLEWAVTPCPWFARRHGLLAAQIAIRHRAKRCRAAWNGHLEACKKFVTEAVGSLPADENLVILGSGHLNDFDLAFLQRRFQNITLIDAVHPLEIQIRARFSSGRLRLRTADLSKPSDGLWESLLANHPLPHPTAEWIWTIAPAGESGPLAEERLIHAFAMNG
jgi:hypothetical protein